MNKKVENKIQNQISFQLSSFTIYQPEIFDVAFENDERYDS
jgi:hypothetical protein